MNAQPTPTTMTPALWMSSAPLFLAVTGIVLAGFVMGETFAVMGFVGLVVAGVFLPLVLTQMAQAERARQTSVGYFLPRWLVIAVCFVGSLLGALALSAGMVPASLVWVALHLVATMPASVIAVALTFRAQRLPGKPHSGPLFEFKWR